MTGVQTCALPISQSSVSDSTVQLIKKVQPQVAGKVPLAVGFGISKPEHVQTVIGAGADAAIVGSAFINIIQNNDKVDMLNKLEAVARNLKVATTKNHHP